METDVKTCKHGASIYEFCVDCYDNYSPKELRAMGRTRMATEKEQDRPDKPNTKFTQQEAIAAILNATRDGGLPLEDRVILLCGIVREQQDQIAQEQQANAALIGWFKEFRQRSCKAAWALAMPGSDAVNFTGFDQQRKGDLQNRHYHQVLSGDASDAFADLAALDTSGYAPQAEDGANEDDPDLLAETTWPGPMAEHEAEYNASRCDGPDPYVPTEGGNRPEHSVGAGPRQEPTHPGAMHRGSAGLPSTGARRS